MNTDLITQKVAEIIFSIGTFWMTVLQAAGLMASPCESPLVYTVGTLDPGFTITQAEVQRALKDAERIWEEGTGQDLFVYQQGSGLPVDFAYDDRQQITEKLQGLEKNLETLPVEQNKEKAASKINEYNAAAGRYEQLVKAYQQQVGEFNREVTTVNNEGGADERTLKILEEKKKKLKQEFDTLEVERRKLNSLATVIDKEVQENQQLVEQYNSVVNNFNQVRGAQAEEFDQGVYTGDAITIYQYDDYQHLVLVLAHELGHALGLDHIEDPQALMYYLMDEQEANNITITQSDKEALNNLCQKPPFPWQ
jgi:predicted Zn-dependent protease